MKVGINTRKATLSHLSRPLTLLPSTLIRAHKPWITNRPAALSTQTVNTPTVLEREIIQLCLLA